MFNFAWNWILLLLPLAWLVHRFMPPAKTANLAALRIPFFANLQAFVSRTQNISTSKTQRWLLYTIWILLIIAAARPQWLGEPIHLPQSGRDIMLALDISHSMQVPDMNLGNERTNRLTIVKHAARQFIEQRSGDRLGLILFGSRAYLQTPLSFDRKTVLNMLEDATIGLAGPRTALGDAIGLAIKRLKTSDKNNRVLILLTDGANNEGILAPLQAAKIAAEQKIKIYTIGIGANQMLISGLLGAQRVNPSADLDEDSLQKIAAMTGGIFFRATNSHELHRVYQAIDDLEPVASKQAVLRPTTPLFHWPLALAFLLLTALMLKKCIRGGGDKVHTGEEIK